MGNTECARQLSAHKLENVLNIVARDVMPVLENLDRELADSDHDCPASLGAMCLIVAGAATNGMSLDEVLRRVISAYEAAQPEAEAERPPGVVVAFKAGFG